MVYEAETVLEQTGQAAQANEAVEAERSSFTKYSIDGLNRLASKTVNGKITHNFAYDNRGNLVRETATGINIINASYVYDATNRMVKGTNHDGCTPIWLLMIYCM